MNYSSLTAGTVSSKLRFSNVRFAVLESQLSLLIKAKSFTNYLNCCISRKISASSASLQLVLYKENLLNILQQFKVKILITVLLRESE